MHNQYLTSLRFPFIESSFLFDKGTINWQDLHDTVLGIEHKIDLDAIKHARKKIWESKMSPEVSVLGSIDLISRSFLTRYGSQIELKNETSFDFISDAHHIWTIITKCIDPNILISWKWRNRNPIDCPQTISVNNPTLNSLFNSGLNDYHLHYGAIGTLEYLLRVIYPSTIVKDAIKHEIINEKAWIKNNNLKSYHVSPYLISLVHGIIAAQVHTFHLYFDNPNFILQPHNYSMVQARRFWKNLEKLLTINIEDVSDINTTYIISKIDTVIKSIIDTNTPGDILTDNRFLCKTFNIYLNYKLNSNKRQYNIYQYYLNKMLWLRNYLYTIIIQQPERGGLSFFKRYYDRIIFTGAKNDNDLSSKVKSLIPRNSNKINILELRFGIEHFLQYYRRFIKEYAYFNNFHNNGYLENTTKVCFIISLNKKWINNTFENGVRYSRFINDLIFQIDQVLAIFENNPKLIYLFRGFDVCSMEKALPNWIFILVLNYINEKANELLYKGIENIPLIKFTFHAGEDFYSPLNGLRNLGEVIKWGPISAHNRIGHGLVLGVDIPEWFKNKLGEKELTTIDIPSGILLDDLLFELLLIRDGLANGKKLIAEEKEVIKDIKTVIEHLRNNIENGYDLKLFNSDNIDALLESYKCRFDYDRLVSSGGISRHCFNLIHNSEWFCYSDVRNLKDLSLIEKLYSEYLISEDLFIAEEEIFPLNNILCEEYILRSQNVQEYMFNFLTDVSIETCPSSNILISNNLDYKKHHAFKLHPINGRRKVHISINSDDPIVFNTNIFNEYQNLFLASRNSDRTIQTSDIVEWLSAINSNSVDYSFYENEAIKHIHDYCIKNGILYDDM